jgi:glyoxylase-like metal-dependent hydrolase (beta-lactamase superfamily II)
MEARKFGHIHFLPGNNNGKYPFCHSLFVDTDKPVIIDPASDIEALTKISESRPGISLINTHYHEDHFAFNYLFDGAPFWVPRADAPAFYSMENLFSYYGYVNDQFQEMFKIILEENFHYRERVPDLEFVDGDILDLGQVKARVVGLPGHTPGHSGFFFEPDDIFFIADMDLTPFGPWYGDAASSLEDTIQSIKKIGEIQAGLYICSHEQGIFKDIGEELREYMKVINTRDEKILAFLDRPRTLEELVDQWIIYGRPKEPEYFFKYSENGMISKHLERLVKMGEVAREQKTYFCKK